MTEKTIFIGLGGQGIISIGQFWAFCAMQEGKKVSFFPFYGAEKRGGIARANVIISDNEIASPVISHADSVIVMSQSSIKTARSSVKEKGLMLVNSTLVTDCPEDGNTRIVQIPATDIAHQAGDARTANMVMLGALAVLTGSVSLAEPEKQFDLFFPEGKKTSIPVNIQALLAGKAAAKEI